MRLPSSKKFCSDLEDLCRHVLKCAVASLKYVNLIEISKQVKEMVSEMREETNRRLKCIKAIKAAKYSTSNVKEFYSNQNPGKSLKAQEKLKLIMYKHCRI